MPYPKTDGLKVLSVDNHMNLHSISINTEYQILAKSRPTHFHKRVHPRRHSALSRRLIELGRENRWCHFNCNITTTVPNYSVMVV